MKRMNVINKISCIVLLLGSIFLIANSAFAQSRSGKTGRISFSPVYALIGAARVQVDFYPDSQVGVGVDAMAWGIGIDNCDFRVQWVIPNGRYFFSEKDDWYVGGGYLVGTANSSCGGEVDFNGAVFDGGYTWLWDTFNIDLGLMVIPRTELEDDEGNKGYFGGGEVQFRLGWMF